MKRNSNGLIILEILWVLQYLFWITRGDIKKYKMKGTSDMESVECVCVHAHARVSCVRACVCVLGGGV
jgi:hypothetical protein